MGIRIGILAVAVVLVAIVFALCQRRLRTKWRKYRPAYRDFLRIGALAITYSQINTSIPTMIDVPWPAEFVKFVAIFNVVNIDLFALIGVSCVGNFNFFLSFLAMTGVTMLIPLITMCDFCCSKKSMLKKVDHMSEPEKELEEEHALRMLYHVADTDGQGSIDHCELASLLQQMGWKVDSKAALETMRHFHDDGSKEWTDEYGHLVLNENEFVEALMGSKMSTLLKSQNIMRIGATIHHETGEIVHTKKSEQESMLCDPDHLIRWINTKRLFANSLSGATMLALLAHTPVSRKVFQFFHCNHIAGRPFLRADYTIECYSLSWYAFSPVVLIVLFVFSLGLPGLIGVYLYRHRTNLYSTYVQQHIGWLYEPFRKGREFWQLHDVFLKAVLTGLLIYIPETARAAVALMVGVCACCSLNYWRPHKSGFLFVLNQLSFISTTFKYAAALMLRVDHSKFNDGSQEMLGWMLIILDLTFLVCGVLCFFIAIYVLKQRINHLSHIKKRMRVLAKTMTSMDGGLAAWKVPEKVNDDGKKKGGKKKKKKKKKKIAGTTKVLPHADLGEQEKSSVKDWSNDSDN